MAQQAKVVKIGPGGRNNGPRPKVENPGKVFKRILAYVMSRYKAQVIVVLCCILLAVFAQLQGVMFSQTLIDSYILPLLKAGIEDKTLLLPRDAGILSDFRSLRVVKGVARVPEQRTKDKTGGRHGDSVIACAMMLDARKELASAEPWEYVGIPLAGFALNGW